MAPPRVPADTLALLRPLTEAAAEQGLPLYAVGGCVRDWLLGRKVLDLDLVTEGDPTGLAQLCGRMLKGRVESFGAFGTLRVKAAALHVDFATARREEYPEPACLPKVKPAGIEKDLWRRDFTINAMALRLRPEGAAELVDPYGGQRDLAAKVLRVLHEASFRDDPTRVFRAARFVCRFGLRPAAGFGPMVRQSLWGCIAGRLSRHRIAMELLRILAEEDPLAPLKRLRSWGYTDLIFPDLRLKTSGRTVEERLGTLVLAQGEKGEEFLKTLPIEHSMARSIKEAWRICRQQASPRNHVSPQTQSILAAVLPGLPPQALRPLLLNGADLAKAGIKDGPRFRTVLDEAARAQWAGRLSTREQALKWLRQSLLGVPR